MKKENLYNDPEPEEVPQEETQETTDTNPPPVKERPVKP